METNEIIQRYIDEIMAESTAEKPLWNKEKIIADEGSSWNYIDGCMLKALLDLYEITGEDRYFKFVENFLDYFINERGEISTYNPLEFNLDNINEGKALMTVYKKVKRPQYKLALDKLRQQLDFQPRTKTGSFWHMLKFPYQVWMDGLYMAQPFYLEWELTFNEGQMIPDIMNQFRNVKMTNQDSISKLYYHGYDETHWEFWANTQTGCSSEFWLRALGWYMMSLVDCCELFGTDYPKERDELNQTLTELAEVLLKYQDKTSSMWYQIIDKPEQKPNYLETSGTLIIAYAMMKAVRLNLLPKIYRKRGEDAFFGTCEKYLVKKNGKLSLGGICIMAGLGETPEQNGKFDYYMSEAIVENEAKGVAPLLMAYTEILQN